MLFGFFFTVSCLLSRGRGRTSLNSLSCFCLLFSAFNKIFSLILAAVLEAFSFATHLSSLSSAALHCSAVTVFVKCFFILSRSGVSGIFNKLL